MKYTLLTAIAVIGLAACNGPAEKAGKERDRAAAAASGPPSTGEGPNQKPSETQDYANNAATDARDKADKLKQQGKAIREKADGRGDKLDAQAKQVRAEANERADVFDDYVEAVR